MAQRGGYQPHQIINNRGKRHSACRLLTLTDFCVNRHNSEYGLRLAGKCFVEFCFLGVVLQRLHMQVFFVHYILNTTGLVSNFIPYNKHIFEFRIGLCIEKQELLEVELCNKPCSEKRAVTREGNSNTY